MQVCSVDCLQELYSSRMNWHTSHHGQDHEAIVALLWHTQQIILSFAATRSCCSLVYETPTFSSRAAPCRIQHHCSRGCAAADTRCQGTYFRIHLTRRASRRQTKRKPFRQRNNPLKTVCRGNLVWLAAVTAQYLSYSTPQGRVNVEATELYE